LCDAGPTAHIIEITRGSQSINLQIDGLYYFKLIRNEPCLTDTEAAATAPDCLRTASQMMNVDIGGAGTFQDLVCGKDCSTVVCTNAILGCTDGCDDADMCCCYPMFDELAFNAASNAAPSVVLMALLLLACLSCFFLA
jgi:hypothetical protein